MKTIKNVFVAGAGAMGAGIAQVSVEAGYSVILNDINEEQLKKASEGIRKNINRKAEKGSITGDEAEAAFGRLSTSLSILGASDADLVIEAISERFELKKAVFNEVCKLCKPDTILASNTSSISCTSIAAATAYPENFVGMHFFNPVPVMKLLELIRGLRTSEETMQAALEFGKTLGKVCIQSKDTVGFIANRMLDLMLNEAVYLLDEGIGTAEDIDNAMKYGCNHPMGPLELIDYAGVDILLAVMEEFYAETGDPKYRPAPLLKRMVRAGHLGRKTGRGFYEYK
ncbi:MAG: 3-hydroxyacyl-CoA dehydrogenase NAD-binding domain-containing protein [Clostridiales bacterium]|nr:3-hydroxyacyl-CoA dehydrogenase NAD-binding domain-containing protein [Clostridiales bacterium]